MEIDFKNPTQLIALTLVVILVAAIAFTVVFKPPTEVNPTVMPSGIPSVSPSTQSPLPSVAVSQQKYDYGNFMLDSKRETQTAADGETTDEETLINEGSGAARFGVAEVFPLSSINDVEITAPPENDSARLGATRHIDANPLTQLTDFELASGQSVSFSARSTKTDLTEKAPVRVLTDADLTAFQRSQLAPVLAKISELVLPLQQARALEAKVNAAFAQVKAQQNAFEDYVDAVEEFVDEIHDETVAAELAKPTPRPTPDVSKMRFTIPTPPKPPTLEELRALLPQMPADLKMEVSENNPADTTPAYLQPKAYFGELLYKVEGDAAAYVTVSIERMDNNYLLLVNADVTKAVKDGKIPFDSKRGTLSVSFSMLPNEKINSSIIITVKHVEATEEPPQEETVEETPKSEPTGDLMEFEIEPKAPDRSIYENFEKAKTIEAEKLNVQMNGHPDTETVKKYHPVVLEAFKALCEQKGRKPDSAGCQIVSGYRDKAYNTYIGGASDSAHLYGLALDINVYGWEKQLEWAEAAKGIFLRSGIYCDDGSSLHVDMMPGRCSYVMKNGVAHCAYGFEDLKGKAKYYCG